MNPCESFIVKPDLVARENEVQRSFANKVRSLTGGPRSANAEGGVGIDGMRPRGVLFVKLASIAGGAKHQDALRVDFVDGRDEGGLVCLVIRRFYRP